MGVVAPPEGSASDRRRRTLEGPGHVHPLPTRNEEPRRGGSSDGFVNRARFGLLLAGRVEAHDRPLDRG
jgi:hypothetical protein